MEHSPFTVNLKNSLKTASELDKDFYSASLKTILQDEDEIPTPEEIENEFPLLEKHKQFIQKSRHTVERILKGQDKRPFLIVGPCSIHDVAATKEYARRFQKLANEVSDQLFLIMRAYFEKPRTILGWKGMLYDPDLDGSYKVAKGIRMTRKLLLELTELHIPIASELLEINTAPYYADFLTWGCVGARTSLSPPHRQLASNLPFPIGFKNTTDGNVENSIRSVYSASMPHIFLGVSNKGKLARVQGSGNPYCHLVLRGGEKGPNYEIADVKKTQEKCRNSGITDKIVIDCSHDNCDKNHLKQIQVFQNVINSMQGENTKIVGLMLESHLFAGSQPLTNLLHYGVSITDPCLDWETTEHLIKEAATKAELALI